MEDPRTIITRWIEEKRLERDATALTWLLQRTAFALLTCYPKGQGQDALWGLFRTIAGAELRAREEPEREGRQEP